MRRTPKRSTFFGVRSRGYRCRLERLESRSMMAADIVEAAVDVVPDEPTSDDRIEESALDAAVAWEGCVLQVCELPGFCDVPMYELPVFVDPTFTDDSVFTDAPMFVDDSCLMVTEPDFQAFEPVDIRVQFVSSESDSSWAAYYYTVAADGVVQGVSVVASYDEPTIAAFAAEHADDPSAQISDYGDGWWIGGFPLELAPPVPDYGVFSDGVWGGEVTGADESSANGSGWDAAGDLAWDQYVDFGAEWTVNLQDSIALYSTEDRSKEESCRSIDEGWSGDETPELIHGISDDSALSHGAMSSDGDPVLERPVILGIVRIRGRFVTHMFPDGTVRCTYEEYPDEDVQGLTDGYQEPWANEPTGDGGPAWQPPVMESDSTVERNTIDGSSPEPAARDPRAAAFADMSVMAAAAVAQGQSAEAVARGGVRRRR